MTGPEEVNVIRRHTERFRDAIDRARRDNWRGNMRSFPQNCCHHACVLLLLYFRQIGLDGFQAYIGRHPVNATEKHHWLQNGCIVVDMTADQFPEVGSKIVVVRHSVWHDALTGKPVPPPTNPNYEEETWEWYGGIYEEILECLHEDMGHEEGKA